MKKTFSRRLSTAAPAIFSFLTLVKILSYLMRAFFGTWFSQSISVRQFQMVCFRKPLRKVGFPNSRRLLGFRCSDCIVSILVEHILLYLEEILDIWSNSSVRSIFCDFYFKMALLQLFCLRWQIKRNMLLKLNGIATFGILWPSKNVEGQSNLKRLFLPYFAVHIAPFCASECALFLHRL